VETACKVLMVIGWRILPAPFRNCYDANDDAFVSLEIDGMTARGYDRRSSSHYSLTVTGLVVQLYDHSVGAWFAFSVQIA
jgi:hypothetical protein